MLLLAALLAPPPEPAPAEPVPLAPSEAPWRDRSGALLQGGIEGFMPIGRGPPSSLGVLRAGMHEYGFEWVVGGGLGASDGAFVWELIAAPGGRVPVGWRSSLPLRGIAGAFAGDRLVLGLEAGFDFALGRVWRLESMFGLRATIAPDDGTTETALGVTSCVVAIP